MSQMQILKIARKTEHFTHSTTFLLLDEPQQHVLVLELQETIERSPIRSSSQKDPTLSQPLTIDFLSNTLHALGGTLSEIELAELAGGKLYAQVHLQEQDGEHVVRASLNDALLLAEREQCKIFVPEEILARRAVSLADYGATPEEQLARVKHLAEESPAALRPALKEPNNLDFAQGLRYWTFNRTSEYGSLALDPQVTYDDKASLAITLHKPYLHGSDGILSYHGFSAEHYRGQRLRLLAYIKTEDIQQPTFELTVHGPPLIEEIIPMTGRPILSVRRTRSRLLRPDAKGWVRHELVIDVPADAQDIRFQLRAAGQGKIWLNGLNIEIVEPDVPLTGTILGPPPQHPVNLDFAEGLEFWSVEESAPWSYEYGVETRPGSPARAYLKASTDAAEASCVLQQLLSGKSNIGKRVRLCADIKTQDVAQQAKLFIGSPHTGLGERLEEVIKGTTAWTSYTLIWRVPKEIWGLMSIGLALHGRGQVWLEGLSLDVLED
ncbi:bifunctional nuclease family protein [Ktedonosporobacter rubrisoli]|uniref:Bifunctional nuclease family protein n=1 Tax=Ktedonosporobacter rubrisoli TaxID=2509675 RepID=A0A4P6JYQ0_KTERU|nr:bifunctional nuclease domain-containing protein [Ktedonosporobacter rubrisoli]QBD80867.1 bifunctional nuclease family protein [Ktedonosporobacter rubrisoli]